MQARYWNWRLWAGFATVLAALFAYVSLFLISRAVFWPCLALLLAGMIILVSGLQHAFREPQTYRGKVAGPLLAILSVVIFSGFTFASYKVFRNFPEARNAPRIGQPAPEFTLVDSSGKSVSLAHLLTAPVVGPSGALHASRGVLVVFYRGYW